MDGPITSPDAKTTNLRTGAQFKEGLKDGRQVWVTGRKLDTVFDEPGLAAGIELIASMFDDAFTPEHEEATTYIEPTTGLRSSRAWMETKTVEDIAGRRKMMEYTAEKTAGVFGRPPDLGPTIVMGIGAQAPLFKDVKSSFDGCRPDFYENILGFIEEGRAKQLTAAESLTGPQNDRSSPMAQAASLLKVVKVEKDGVYISGAKSVGSVAAQADEIIFTNLGYPGTPPEACIWGSVPIASEGIKLVSREMLSEPHADPFDHPLNHKGEEADQLVIYDNVFVPKHRIFNLGDADVLGLSGKATLWAHWHILTRLMVKSEIYVGCAEMVTQILGTDGIPAVRGMLGEIVEFNRALKAFLIAAEANPQVMPSGVLGPDVSMITAGRLYGVSRYPNVIHTLQEMCGQGLVMRFGKASFENPDIKHHLEELLPGRGCTGMEKEQLMNFIWDLTTSGLAGRVALFENVNATPAPRLRERLFMEFDRSGMVDRAKRVAGM